MTTLEAAPRTAPSASVAEPGHRPPARLALAVIAAAVWLLGGFWAGVQHRSPRQDYAAPVAHAQWVRSAGSGPRAWFVVEIPAGGPVSSATIWVDADQEATVYVNGWRANSIAAPPDHNIDTPIELTRAVQEYPLTAGFTTGYNLIGVEVVNLAGRQPAFRGVVEVRNGPQVVDYGTRPSDWLSTSDVTVTGQSAPQSGTFTSPGADLLGYQKAVAAGARSGSDSMAVYPPSLSTPIGSNAIYGRVSGGALVASTRFRTPPGCDASWLRVAATGPYTVALDGTLIASGGGGSVTFGAVDTFGRPKPPKAQILSVYDICPVLSGGGTHTLTVSVTSPREPAFYLDAEVRGEGRVATVSSGPGWSGTSEIAGDDVSTGPLQGFQLPMQPVTAALHPDQTGRLVHHVWLSSILLLVAAVAVGGAVLRGLSLRRAVVAAAAGLLPALGLFAVLTESRHIVTVLAPFPTSPAMLVLLFTVAAAGLAGGAVLAGRRPEAAPPSAAEDRTGWTVRRLRDVRWARTAAGPVERLRRASAEQHYRFAVFGLTALVCVFEMWNLAFEPLWQDELSSLAAAQGVQHHLIPEWPSGFQYWKSELYSLFLAVVGPVVHESTTWLRATTVLWLGATIVLFGLALAPLLLRSRGLQFLTTAAFALSPIELGHARDIRMYQMAQFFVILLAVMLLRALRQPTRRSIAVAMVVVVVMYLSHEETFGVLFVVPVVLVARHRLRWLRDRNWLIWGGAAVAVVVVQLALTTVTHPPYFGQDESNGGLVKWSPTPFFYLQNFFFTKGAQGAALTVISALAVVAIVFAVKRRNFLRMYVAAYWIIPIFIVSLFLPAKDTRYGFISLPFCFVLAGCGTSDLADQAQRLIGAATGSSTWAGVLRWSAAAAAAVAVWASLIGGPADYGPLTMALAHTDSSHRQLDYGRADAFVARHLLPGDSVIAASSANLVGYGIGAAPTYWMPYRSNSIQLYLIERHNQAVDTQYGTPTILSANDLERALGSHQRTWLIIADSNVKSLQPAEQALLLSRLSLVSDGETVSVYRTNS